MRSKCWNTSNLLHIYAPFFCTFNQRYFGELALRFFTIIQTQRFKTTTSSMNGWNTQGSGIISWYAWPGYNTDSLTQLKVIWDPLFISQISLEHAFHLMLNGYLEEAKDQLSVAESWRHGKESAVQHQKSKLIQAYRSLLDYIIWCDKKNKLSHRGKMIQILTG